MKTFSYLTMVAVISLFSSTSWTYVLPFDFVSKKLLATTGRQIIALEQEVSFKVGTEETKTTEQWLIEGDRNLKVNAQGTGFLKDSFAYSALFNNKNKTQVLAKNKTTQNQSADFFQKLLFVRSLDSFKVYLKELNIAEQTRLSRADGRVCVAIGLPSEESTATPQLWIDQDDFLIRKIRLPSGSEIALSDYVKIGNDLWIAKQQSITWGGITATIKVKSINTKTGETLKAFYPQNFDRPTDINFANKTPLTLAVEDFYKRFR